MLNISRHVLSIQPLWHLVLLLDRSFKDFGRDNFCQEWIVTPSLFCLCIIFLLFYELFACISKLILDFVTSVTITGVTK